VKLHILGIGGTFMAGLALIAQELGHEVSGTDQNLYPPMSDLLQQRGISVTEGYSENIQDLKPDLWIIGNAMRRGNTMIEAILDRGDHFQSGPEWLHNAVLKDRWVVAVAGTHGKTTTTALITWVMESLGAEPGFLIGGIPTNFGVSARLGKSDFFIIEADEYDTAFFDKRSKFVHYHPRTLIINNLEFDHADIFPDLAAIQKQFHHVIRTVPRIGSIIYPSKVEAIEETLVLGCWSDQIPLSCEMEFSEPEAIWQARLIEADGSHFDVLHYGQRVGEVRWDLIGKHNVSNALATVAAVHSLGFASVDICQAMTGFQGIARRMQKIAEINNICLYDDFAHHPTAIQTTLAGLRAKVGTAPIIAILEVRSNTMRMGVHHDMLESAVKNADATYWLEPSDLSWSLSDTVKQWPGNHHVFGTLEELMQALIHASVQGQHWLIMSNGSFGGIYKKLPELLTAHSINKT
ncbi:MAG: UDP-N-acetylmuramate:L-alanyl-gamma-D-glutamyl-meso-diaminopimelate ligase, partial [Pseudomonadota bacterium]